MTGIKKKNIPHLIVDGHNMLHAVQDWKRLFLEDSSAARERLLETLRVLADYQEMFLTVVFDGSGASLSSESLSDNGRFVCLYAPADLTADGVIEQCIASARTPETITVATRDHMIGEVARAAGAFVIDEVEMLAWVDRVTSEVSRKIALQKTTGPSTISPFDALDGLFPREKDRE